MEVSSTRSLMLAVIQDRDLALATSALKTMNIPVVHLSIVGGFSGMRNATLLIELREGQKGDVRRTLEKSCHKRVAYVALPPEVSKMWVQ